MDGNVINYTYQGQTIENGADDNNGDEMPLEEALRKFVKFIREWQHDNKHIYR